MSSTKPSNNNNNVVQQRLQMKEKKKDTMMMCLDHNKVVTRELSNLSNEAYHVESSSIPFVWESQPGTPKVRFHENPLPPLTPPPSYFQNATNKKTKNNKNSPKSSFLQTLFPKRATRKGGVVPPQAGSHQNIWSYSSSSPSSSTSSSSTSSSLSFSSPRPRSYSVPSSPMIHSRKGDQEDELDLYEVNSSGLCFGNARSRGCYSSMFKKVLLGDFL